jgi:hypothetical protein
MFACSDRWPAAMIARTALDLLVEVEQGRSLLDIVGLEQDLADLLGCRVDVPTDMVDSVRTCSNGSSTKPPHCERRRRLSETHPRRPLRHFDIHEGRPRHVPRRACASGCNAPQIGSVGQAVKTLSDATKSRRPDIPWKQIAGMRDKMIHDYFAVNLEIVCGLWSSTNCRDSRSPLTLFSQANEAVPGCPGASVRGSPPPARADQLSIFFIRN